MEASTTYVLRSAIYHRGFCLNLGIGPIYGSGLKHGDIQSVVNHILEKSDVHVSKTFEKNIDRFMASAATIDPKNVDREELLGMVNRRFYPHLAGELSRTPYFLDIDLINGRITVQKSQRLSKLFGEQLSMKDLKNQVSQHINEEDLIFSVTETSPIYEEEPSEAAQRSSNVKKFSRIKGFFGEAIPMTDVKNQLHQGSETSLLNEESEAVEKVSAENADEKDKLMKTWIKLQAFLGERVPLRLMMSQKKYSSTSKLEDTDALLDSSQPERQDPAHHFSSAIRAMSKLIHNSKDAIDLLIAFSILDADSEQRVVSEVHSSSAVHQKKAVKLEALLGSEVGVTSVIRQIESKILTDLQKWIHLEIKNPEDVTKLTEDLNLLRKTFDAKISLMALDVAS